MTETMAQKPATTRIPRQLRESDVHGKGAAEIGWGTPGDFDRCRAFMRRHDVPGHEIDGACANLHRIATGEWPGRNAHKGHLASAAVISLTAAAAPDTANLIQWEGPLARIESPTGDRRQFPRDTLTYQSFPQPLRYQRQGLPGHQGAVTVGAIRNASEQDVDAKRAAEYDIEPGRYVWGSGYFLDPKIVPEVNEAVHQIEHGVSGPSVDLDSFTAVLSKTLSGETVANMKRGRQRAATLVSVPAFADLRIKVTHPKALTASSDVFAVNSTGWHGAPIAPREALFDADDATKRIEGWANGDPKKMASMFLWIADSANAPLIGRKGYRLPWGDIVEGKPYLIYHAVYAAAALLEGAHGGLPNIPDEEKAKLRAVVSSIYEDLAAEYNDPSIVAPWDRGAQTQQASGEVAWTDGDGDEYASYACSYTAALEEFVRHHRYTESKHPRDKRKNDHAGEWVDTPHGPHGQIKVGSKWVYPPKRGEKGYKNPEASARAIAKRGGGAKVGKKRPDPDSDAGRQRRTVRHGPSTTERERAKDQEKARRLREVAGNHKPEPREEPKRKAPVGKAEPKPEPKERAPRAAEPEKAPARKAVVGKKQPVHKVSPAQQRALEALRDDENAKIHPATRKVLEREGYLDENGKLTDKAHKHLGSKPKAKTPEPQAEPEPKAAEPEPKKAPARKAVVGKKQPAGHKLTTAQKEALVREHKNPGAKIHPATKKVLQREGYLDGDGKLTTKAYNQIGIPEENRRKAPVKKVTVAPKVPGKAAPKERSSKPIDTGKFSDKAQKRNGWGGRAAPGTHYFHPDGAVGRAMSSLGADGKIDVDGDRLDNRLGDIATQVLMGAITPQEGVDQYKKIRDRLPEDSRARRVLDSAIYEMDAPEVERPKSATGAPQPLQDLMDQLLDNPLARGNRQASRGRPDYQSEIEILDEMLKSWHEGNLSKRQAVRELREKLLNRHHESNEGKVPLDRAVVEAMDQISDMDEVDFRAAPPKPHGADGGPGDRKPLDKAAGELGAAYAAGAAKAKRKRIMKGAQGSKERVTLPDGREIFSKQLTPQGLFKGHDGVAEADSEELASLMGRAFGAPVPVVARQGDTHILMDWVDGKAMNDVAWGDDVRKAQRTPEHRLMGLLDALSGNTDRHFGNIMIADGKPVAIDNGLAWVKMRDGGSPEVVARRFMLNPGGIAAEYFDGLENDLTPADVAKLGKKLEALRPQFAARNREQWLEFSLAVLKILGRRAHGDKDTIK